MRRREFITLLGGVATWPVAAHAQQTGKVYRIGFITAGSASFPPFPTESQIAFTDGLQALGWIVGKNLIYEARYAENRLDRLPELAAELVRLNVDVIITAGTRASLAAKQATATIPIVLIGAGDPLGSGLIASLARPGGNVTGTSLMAPDLAGKRLELLREILPGLSHVAVLWNATNPYSALVFKETGRAAQLLRIEVQSLELRSTDDLDSALENAIRQNASALITVEDTLSIERQYRIVEFAAKTRLPAIYGAREFVDAGGLMAYGANFADLSRRTAGFVDKILKGAKPSDLPVEQPTKFEFVINMKTAKALGLTVPTSLLLRADEVIE